MVEEATQVGGDLKGFMTATKSLVKTSGNIVNDLAVGLSNVIGGITNGVEIVAEKAGSTIKNVSDDVAVVSTKVFRHVGDIGNNIAKGLGNVVEVVPILGRPTAYIVKGAGKGVYYVVTTVGNVAGETLKGVGALSKKAGDVVVFTIMTTSDITENTIKSTGKLVQNVANLGASKKSRRSKQKKYKTVKGGMRRRRTYRKNALKHSSKSRK